MKAQGENIMLVASEQNKSLKTSWSWARDAKEKVTYAALNSFSNARLVFDEDRTISGDITVESVRRVLSVTPEQCSALRGGLAILLIEGVEGAEL